MKIKAIPFLMMVFVGLITSAVSAQADKSTRPSPPAMTEGTVQGAHVMISYSAPSVKGRTIWGDLVPYGKVWRTGANEATTIETDKDITIQGKTLPAGKYALFTIPGETEWTWIFNSVWEQWGAYRYDESKDVLRVMAKPRKTETMQEQLRFDIMDNEVLLYWENLVVGF